MAHEEQVLVVERKVFDELGAFRGLQFDVGRYLDRLFAPGVPRFMPRPQAEKDPSFKQLIPYVLMTCEGKYLTYVRGKRAGETRLVGNRSHRHRRPHQPGRRRGAAVPQRLPRGVPRPPSSAK